MLAMPASPPRGHLTVSTEKHKVAGGLGAGGGAL